MRILELARRNELAEDGAQHIVNASMAARRRWSSPRTARSRRCSTPSRSILRVSGSAMNESRDKGCFFKKEIYTRLHQVKTLADIDIDQTKVKLKDAESKLKGEVVEQKRRANFYENECMGKGLVEEQLRHEKQMTDP
eukprot:s3561_g15.t1